MKIATRSRSNVFATAVKGQTMGTERMVVPTIAQSENLSSASCSKLPFANQTLGLGALILCGF